MPGEDLLVAYVLYRTTGGSKVSKRTRTEIASRVRKERLVTFGGGGGLSKIYSQD